MTIIYHDAQMPANLGMEFNNPIFLGAQGEIFLKKNDVIVKDEPD
jgi:hypothetical protein